MNSTPRASIVILDFLKSKRVVENVESIQKQHVDFPFEVIIVDNSNSVENARKLRQLEKYENVRLIFNQKNLGYTRGTNCGVNVARGEYIFIVNPDIVWSNKDAFMKLVEFLDLHPRVGVVGPKQINDTDGSVAMTVRAFPRFWRQIARRMWLRRLPIIRPKVEFDEMRHLDYTQTQPVDWLQSSFIVVRRSLWNQLGGFNERFFLFMSDPDFCWKMWSAGFEVIYLPEVIVNADGLRCSAGGFLDFFCKWTLRQHFRDALKYHIKYFWRKNPRQ